MKIKLFKYSENEYSFLSDKKINIGDELEIGKTKDGIVITKIVTEIIEQRSSNGIFSGNHPEWTRLKLL